MRIVYLLLIVGFTLSCKTAKETKVPEEKKEEKILAEQGYTHIDYPVNPYGASDSNYCFVVESAWDTITIYNRWGNKVWQTISNASNCWLGKDYTTDRDLPAGVYFYVINLSNSLKKVHGTISLIR